MLHAPNQKTFGLSKQQRLLKTDEFSSVFNFKKRVSGHYIALHYQPSHTHPSAINARLGLVVAKKIVHRSVDRNYIRRVLRELFRLHQHEIANLDVVVRVQRKFGRAQYPEITQEFATLLLKMRRRSQQNDDKALS